MDIDKYFNEYVKLLLKTIAKVKPKGLLSISADSDYDKGYADGKQDGVNEYEKNIIKILSEDK